MVDFMAKRSGDEIKRGHDLHGISAVLKNTKLNESLYWRRREPKSAPPLAAYFIEVLFKHLKSGYCII